MTAFESAWTVFQDLSGIDVQPSALGDDPLPDLGPRPVYEASSVKRVRRSDAELDALDSVIVRVIADDSPVTLRGVYYRVVSACAVAKTEQGYQLIGRQLLKLRRSGRVSYDAITDGTRYVMRPTTYGRLDRMLLNAARSYRRELWANQDVEVQVFTEKDAISGVISPITDEWDIPLAVVRGYCSESFAYSLGESVRMADKPVIIYQLGDHDPSGVDAWRDLQRKVRLFAPDADVTFERLAVTPDQIGILGLQTRPTKRTDTRARGFEGESVEIDAIPARILRDILRQAIEQHVDQAALSVTIIAEASEREILTRIAATRWAS